MAGIVKNTTNNDHPSQNSRGRCWETRHARRHTSMPLPGGRSSSRSTSSTRSGFGSTSVMTGSPPARRPTVLPVVDRSSGESIASARRRAKWLSSSPTSSARGPNSATTPWSNTTMSSTACSVDRRWAMIKRRATDHQPGDGGFDLTLGLRVDARRRLVEHEHVRIAHPHPRQRQQLRLARRTGRCRPNRVGDRSRRRRDRRDRRRGARRRRARRRRVVEQRHVVTDGAGEQFDLLRHEGRLDGAARAPGCPRSAHRRAATVPLRRLDEPQHEPRERRLAAPGAPDDADRATRSEFERDVAQHRLVVAVVEVDVFEARR